MQTDTVCMQTQIKPVLSLCFYSAISTSMLVLEMLPLNKTLVVGFPCLGLDSRFYVGLCQSGGDDLVDV
jgi:hypothetical protein